MKKMLIAWDIFKYPMTSSIFVAGNRSITLRDRVDGSLQNKVYCTI